MFTILPSSLSSLPDAPWHDESLHALALLIEEIAGYLPGGCFVGRS